MKQSSFFSEVASDSNFHVFIVPNYFIFKIYELDIALNIRFLCRNLIKRYYTTIYTMAKSKPTRIEDQIDDLTQCSICTKTLTEPKDIPCFHTFCFEMPGKYVLLREKT